MPKYTVHFEPNDNVGSIKLQATDRKAARFEARDLALRYPHVRVGAVTDERGNGGIVLVNRTSFPFLKTVPRSENSN